MPDFYHTALKAINDYKAILRRNLPATKCAEKIRNLSIKRKHLKIADEITLYNIGQSIIKELEQNNTSNEKNKLPYAYVGTDEFLKFLQEMFADYRLENGKVVHATRIASRALIAAIQLISLPDHQIGQGVTDQLREYGQVIHSYGNPEQIKVFNNAIKQHTVICKHFSLQLT